MGLELNARVCVCSLCRTRPVARVLGFCGPCLRDNPDAAEAAREAIRRAHDESRRPFPGAPPRTVAGSVVCAACGNRCQLGPGEPGFCGLRENSGGRLETAAGTAQAGLASWYHDPLPTNCVADWVCPAGTGSGYPEYAHRPGPEFGYDNLAVFLGGCSFDCLFCQNRSYHRMARARRPFVTPEEVAAAVTPRTACICYFGGDPSPQMPFALRAARLARAAAAAGAGAEAGMQAGGRVLRICWETNGNVAPQYLEPLAELSLISGGCVKLDLKAYSRPLHEALTGVGNEQTLANLAVLAGYAKRRPDPPFLIASTLLVPGYVDTAEVAAIAGLLAGLDPTIPYALLAFHPQHLFSDLPVTTRREAEACLDAAQAAGLTRVNLGNRHLLIGD